MPLKQQKLLTYLLTSLLYFTNTNANNNDIFTVLLLGAGPVHTKFFFSGITNQSISQNTFTYVTGRDTACAKL